jgi:hypothetical protein
MRQILHRKEQQPGNALPHKALIYKKFKPNRQI